MGAKQNLELIDQGLVSGHTVQSSFRFVAEAFLAVHDVERAERFAEGLRAHPNATGRLREAYLEVSVGEVMLGLGRPEQGERPFARAITLAEAVGARSTLAVAALGAAQVAAARGDARTSTRQLERAVGIAREMGLGHLLARAARLAAGGEEAAGRI